MIPPGDDDNFGLDDDLASFLNEDNDSKESPEDDFLDNDLFAFLNEDQETGASTEAVDDDSEEDLFAFMNDDAKEEAIAGGGEKEEEEEEETSILGELLGKTNQKPEALLPFKQEKRKARVDITKNSKEDHREVKRYTKKEISDQLIKDYRYMMAKNYMMIQPVTIMEKYPYKKKKKDSDIIEEKKNVEEDYILVIGKLQKWRSTEQFRGKAYILGHIMYVRKGDYWINGEVRNMDPHFAIVPYRKYKRIKSKRIRDLLKPLKYRLRTGKPFTIYKEFPMIVKRTGLYS
jgi:hypothetical protein